jgi:hypothetical protein
VACAVGSARDGRSRDFEARSEDPGITLPTTPDCVARRAAVNPLRGSGRSVPLTAARSGSALAEASRIRVGAGSGSAIGSSSAVAPSRFPSAYVFDGRADLHRVRTRPQMSVSDRRRTFPPSPAVQFAGEACRWRGDETEGGEVHSDHSCRLARHLQVDRSRLWGRSLGPEIVGGELMQPSTDTLRRRCGGRQGSAPQRQRAECHGESNRRPGPESSSSPIQGLQKTNTTAIWEWRLGPELPQAAATLSPSSILPVPK